MKTSRLLISAVCVPLCILTFFSLLATVRAQMPNTLRHTLFSPGDRPQTGAEQGSCVALDGTLAVVGAYHDDTRQTDSGVVKVFNASTGQLLHTLINPNPASSSYFGYAVAVSGTRIVVGAIGDDLGALDAGRAYVFDVGTATPTVPIATLNNPAPTQSDQFGWAVAISGTRVMVGARANDTPTIMDAGSVYVYDLASASPTVPIVTMDNPTPAANEYFGTAVAIAGTRVVVGADWENTGASHAGSAYVYELTSATPTVPIHTLNNPTPGADDRFGAAVAISGTRVVVAALSDDLAQQNAGSVYVYQLTSATPTVPVVTLNDVGNFTNGIFGVAISISGSRVAVGAQRDSTGGVNRSGIAFIFDMTSPTPRVPVKTINEPSPNLNDLFGRALAISGNIALVSASRDDTFAQDSGRTWVFDVTGPNPLSPTATLDSPSPAAGDEFGIAVAISGSRLIVGADREDASGEDAGSAYVYDLASTAPTIPVVALRYPQQVNSAVYYGNAVGISGGRAVVGAWRADSDRGRAYVYDLESANPSVPVLAVQDSTSSNFFGAAVAISGNYVAVGAYGDNTGADDAGRVYVYDLTSATPTVPLITINNPAPFSFARFGIAVTMSGTHLAVGASRNLVGTITAGVVYVFNLASATPAVPIAALTNPAPTADARFGDAVGISGTFVVVGAPNDDQGATDAGRAYVFDIGTTTPAVPVATLNNPSPAATDNFGKSVAISGNRVAVGASGDDFGATDAGRAYIYVLGGANPTTPVATLGKASAGAFDAFGYSVAIDGLTVAVGAPFDDSTIVNKGAAYIFVPELAPPAGGTFTLTPQSPVSPGAAITASASGWTDASPPLTYQFSLDGTALGSRGASALVNFTAPTVLGTHTVGLRVFDAANNFTEVSRNFVVNDPPTARAATLGATGGSTASFSATKLLAYGSDPNGDALAIIAVSPGSERGGMVTLSNGIICYTPPVGFSGADSFTYTLQDARGATATGIVNVTVAQSSAPSLNVISITGTADGFLVKFAGIPGTSYRIQYRDALTDAWQALDPPGAIQTGPNGVFQHEDKPNPIPASRFYRATEAP